MGRIDQYARDSVVEMFEAGMKPSEIAFQVDISLPSVYNILKAANVDTSRERGRRDVPLESQEKLLKLYMETDHSVPSIAQEAGVPLAVAYRMIKDSGLNRPIEMVRQHKTQVKLDAAVEAWLKGAKLWEIKRDHEVWSNQLYAELHRRGIHPREVRGLDRPAKEASDGKQTPES